MFFLYTTGCSLTWNEIAVILESFMKVLLGICGFFFFSYLVRITQSPCSIPVWQLIKSFQKPHISWFAFPAVCKGCGRPLEGAVLSDYNLSPMLAAGWQPSLAAGDPRYLLLSIKHGKGPPQVLKWGWVLSNSFVTMSVGGFFLLSWRIAMNYCALRRVFNRDGSKFIERLLSTQNCSKCSAYISLFHPHNNFQTNLIPKLQIRTEAQRG